MYYIDGHQKNQNGAVDTVTLPAAGKIVIQNFESIVYYESSYAIEFKTNLIKNPLSTTSFYDLHLNYLKLLEKRILKSILPTITIHYTAWHVPCTVYFFITT